MGLFKWFKPKPDPAHRAAPVPADPPAVTPRVVRSAAPHELRPVNLTGGAITPRIDLPASQAGSFPVITPRVTIAHAHPPAPPDADERSIVLGARDFAGRIPAGYLRHGAASSKASLHLTLADVFTDLTQGRATVPLREVYRRCPEIFARPVPEDDQTLVSLPLQPMVAQIGVFETRPDQIAPDEPDELDTPIGVIAREDGASPVPTPVHTPHPPPMPVRPAQFPPPAPAAVAQDAPAVPLASQAPVRFEQPSMVLAPPPVHSSPGPILPGRRPPATVRARIAGGRITLRPTRSAPVVHSPAFSPVADPVPQAAAPPPRVAPSPMSLAPGISSLPGAATSSGPPRREPIKAPSQPPSTGDPASRPAAISTSAPRTAIPMFAPPGAGVVAGGATPSAGTPGSAGNRPAFRPRTPGGTPSAPPGVQQQPRDTGQETISLSLAAIVRGLSPAILRISPPPIPPGVRVTFPLTLIAPQLAKGRVTLSLQTLREAAPRDFHEVFSRGDPEAQVTLPLAEIFQNLPKRTLTMRPDQEMEEIGEEPTTSFGDLDVPAVIPRPVAPVDAPHIVDADAPAPGAAAPIELPRPTTPIEPAEKPAKNVPVEEPPPAIAIKPAEAAAVSPTPGPAPTSPVWRKDESDGPQGVLQALFMTEELLDARRIVSLTSELPGIGAAVVMFADGLPIAGNLPEGFDTDAFGAIAPRFFQKVREAISDLRLGGLESVTLHADRGPVTFFMCQHVCLAVLHDKNRFMPGVREKLVDIVRELSKLYPVSP